MSGAGLIIGRGLVERGSRSRSGGAGIRSKQPLPEAAAHLVWLAQFGNRFRYQFDKLTHQAQLLLWIFDSSTDLTGELLQATAGKGRQRQTTEIAQGIVQ